MRSRSILKASILALLLTQSLRAAPNFRDTIQRPLRYEPVGTDFKSLDGRETFNRPLYGSGTPFRVDAGDRPEFSLFLPGRGGVLRLGMRRGDQSKWLIDAAEIEAIYSPGAMRYTIRDPILGEGELLLDVMASFVDEALLVRAQYLGTTDDIELLAAFGGATGERGARNGDLGTEKQPVREFFQLQPAHCAGNVIDIGPTGADGTAGDGFTLTAKPAILIGRSQPALQWSVRDAANWADPRALFNSDRSETPVVAGHVSIDAGTPIHLRIDRRPLPATQPSTRPAAPPPPLVDSNFAADFIASEQLRAGIANRLRVETPDAYLNAAVAALNVAAEGTWDSRERAIMHGAVAWRSKLLGWRGIYWPDALGLHDRAPLHLNQWFDRQNLDPIPAQIPAPEASANLSRNEDALHSNGNLTDNHYDMNLVAFDALFRHLLWTGDLDYAKKVWPVIERHLAWERRLFRRPFPSDDAPLYEAYAGIWASDDLYYNGGGVTHASAYNAFHNQMAARIATWIGQDPTPYLAEHEAIRRTMHKELWLADLGHYAEWKDALGLKLVHPDAAAWTVYHTIDSDVASPTHSPTEAWQLARYAMAALPRLPIEGANVSPGTFQIATSDWTPYQWSTNNVVMSESAHTALALFRAGRVHDAFALLKGCILDSMFLGQCPGNVGMATPLDMARGETQRDFADGCGSLSRAIVEGLFGIRPDAIAGTLTLEPRFPREWNAASIAHASLGYTFTRAGDQDTYALTSRQPAFKHATLILTAPRDGMPSVTVNGQPADATLVPDCVGAPKIAITFPLTATNDDAQDTGPHTIQITWSGKPITPGRREHVVARGQVMKLFLEGITIESFDDPQQVARDWTARGTGFLSGVPVGAIGHRTAFANVKQGVFSWRWPIELDVREPIEILPASDQAGNRIAFTLRNNGRETIDQMLTFRVGGSLTGASTADASGPSATTHGERIRLRGGEAIEKTFPINTPGTHIVRLFAGEKPLAFGSVTNWHVTSSSKPATGPSTTSTSGSNAPNAGPLEAIDLTTAFNAKVTDLFRNEYLSPRSPYVSLAVPRQGIGTWCKPAKQFDVDDAGLRATAARFDGRLDLGNGVHFATPGAADVKNTLFVSQWDTYPVEAVIPLAGRASHAYLLMAGSTQSMQSRFDNGEVIITYTDDSTDRLALRNPETWWPIDQDYPIDDFAFRHPAAIPPRVDLKTGTVRLARLSEMKGKGRTIDGGAATVLDLPLDDTRELKSITVRALANEVVIGLMGVTLRRPG